MKDQTLNLLRLNAYNLWSATLCAGPPKLTSLFDELRNPKPGDLVMEVTTFWKTTRDPLEGIGRLQRIVREPTCTPEQWEENGNEDQPIPDQQIYYITLDFDDGREFRWHNAMFVKVKEDKY